MPEGSIKEKWKSFKMISSWKKISLGALSNSVFTIDTSPSPAPNPKKVSHLEKKSFHRYLDTNPGLTTFNGDEVSLEDIPSPPWTVPADLPEHRQTMVVNLQTGEFSVALPAAEIPGLIGKSLEEPATTTADTLPQTEGSCPNNLDDGTDWLYVDPDTCIK